MSATNGVKKFLFVVIFENSPCIDVLRSDHEPSAEEISEALGHGVEFDPDRDKVIRFNEDSIINLPKKGNP